MPPKKQPSKLTPQGSSLNPSQTAGTLRQPLPVPPLPASDTIPPLWTSNAVPTAVFPEWTDPATLPPEHWGSVGEPYKDPLSPSRLFLPREYEQTRDTITWKRPCEFLPAIVDTPAVLATPTPTAPDPKAKKVAATATKKEAEQPKKPPPPKHAHIYLSKSAYASLEHKRTAGVISTPGDPHQDQESLIPRDFQRRWSAEETGALAAWFKEEDRIEREKQQRERVYMAFEDAIAYIVNERPRDLLAEVDFDAEDLVDDGEDEDEGLQSEMDSSNATSPWGVMPPPRIEIAPNSVYKPEVPHGTIVHADMASCFRIVEQLHSSHCEKSSDTSLKPTPLLWQAIYPQDNTGHPIYNPGGKYTVKLFVLGRWRRVDVDDRLPLDSDGNVVYLASSLRNEIWPSLLVKALYKVMYWLHPNVGHVIETRTDLVGNVCQSTAQIMLTLTSWKISRWEPRASQSFSDNVFHQLLQYVSTQHLPEDVSETKLDSEAVAESTAEMTTVEAEIPEPVKANSSKPRAIICCADEDSAAALTCGEVVLVVDVVGDTGNTTFKITRQGAPATISEEVTGMNELVFLLVHPTLSFSDSIIRSWVPRPEAVLDAATSSIGALVPFESPRVHFLVMGTEKKPEQVAGDSSSSYSHDSQALVTLVATLTPVQPQDDGSQQRDSISKSSSLMATHLGVDPNGSVVLIEEPEKNNLGRFPSPSIMTLNSILSEYMQTPLATKGSVVYRVYPQTSLRYGYSLQVDCDHPVSFQDASSYWRGISTLHVVESDGTYPVMLPGTWNILFKHSFELTPPTTETEEDGEELVSPSCAELRVDLHLSEELLARFTHISIVNDLTSEVTRVGTLCSKISLPIADKTASSGELIQAAYTLIVDCSPGDFHVREGTWKLTLASDWDFTKSTTHRTKLTRFEGAYVPNKPLLCFRDVIAAPKASIWTSFQLQLLRDNTIATDLAAKLETFDFGADQHPKVGEVSSVGDVRLLQLPSLPVLENAQTAEEKRGLIIQGSIDKAICIVPSELQSLRPFRINTQRDGGESGDLETFGTGHSFRVPSSIKWRLNCWSAEEVKLQEDNTKELQFEAIRASWAETAIGRNTNGAVSRLLYLGKVDEAETKMKQEGVTDDQMAKIRSRHEWTQSVREKVGLNSYLEEVASADEKLLTDEQLEESRRVLHERIGIVEADREQRRVARAVAKEERAKELRDLVRSVVERRAASHKLQQEQKRAFAALQHTQSA